MRSGPGNERVRSNRRRSSSKFTCQRVKENLFEKQGIDKCIPSDHGSLVSLGKAVAHHHCSKVTYNQSLASYQVKISPFHNLGEED